jgi:N-acetylglucosaminyldiphosphoundecaprenol N-acetyl-beta-D-mannosaminyltransferase
MSIQMRSLADTEIIMGKIGFAPFERLDILGVQLTLCDPPAVLHYIRHLIHHHQQGMVLTLNVNAINLAQQNLWLRVFFNTSDVILMDGAGVKLGAKLLGYDIPYQHIGMMDFIWDIAELALQTDARLFLLGGLPGVAEEAAAVLKGRVPHLTIVGTHHGYFDKHPDHPENQAVIAQINHLQPHILLVGFGMPLQEKWLRENHHQLQINVAITCGGLFDFLSGRKHRPPRWMTNLYLEWLGRLLTEPRRLWRRYVLGNPLFLWRILKQRFGFFIPPT